MVDRCKKMKELEEKWLMHVFSIHKKIKEMADLNNKKIPNLLVDSTGKNNIDEPKILAT